MCIRDRERAGRVAIAFGSWFLALVLLFLSQSFHEREWFATHDFSAAPTEEELMELGDYPNVFAGWLFFGWVPVLAASITARLLFRPKKS